MVNFRKILALTLLVCISLSGCRSEKESDELAGILEKYGYSSDISNPEYVQGFYIISQHKKTGQNSNKTYRETLYAYKPFTMTIEYADLYKKADADVLFDEKWNGVIKSQKDSEPWSFDTEDYKIELTSEKYWTTKLDRDTYKSDLYGYHLIIQIAKGSKLLFIDATGSILEFENDMGIITECCSVVGYDISPLQSEMSDYLNKYMMEASAVDTTSDENLDSTSDGVNTFLGWST